MSAKITFREESSGTTEAYDKLKYLRVVTVSRRDDNGEHGIIVGYDGTRLTRGELAQALRDGERCFVVDPKSKERETNNRVRFTAWRVSLVT